MNKIKIIALIGKSAAGKDAIMQKMVSLCPSLHEIISCTSRPMRENERHGINYYYYSDKEFEEKIKRSEMFEYTSFNGWFYGTSFDSIKPEAVNIGVFNPEGIRTLLSRDDLDVIIVEVRAADKERLLRQLNRQQSPDVAEIIRRYGTDEKDFNNLGFVSNHIIENMGDLEKTSALLLETLGLVKLDKIDKTISLKFHIY